MARRRVSEVANPQLSPQYLLEFVICVYVVADRRFIALLYDMPMSVSSRWQPAQLSLERRSLVENGLRFAL
jgi:hypothetical protein